MQHYYVLTTLKTRESENPYTRLCPVAYGPFTCVTGAAKFRAKKQLADAKITNYVRGRLIQINPNGKE